MHLELFNAKLLRVEGGLALGLLLLFIVVGPLGTKEDTVLLMRAAYWGSCTLACWPVCYAVDGMTLYFTRHWTPARIVLATTIGALTAAVPCTAVLYTFYKAFFGSGPAVPTFGEIFVVVAVVIVVSISLLHFIACQFVKLKPWWSTGATPPRVAGPPKPAVPRHNELDPASVGPAGGSDETDHTGPDPSDQASPSITSPVTSREGPRQEPRAPVAKRGPDTESDTLERFLRHLPDHLGRDVISLKAVEHYVEVTTAAGSALILMRFSDAVAELAHLGMRVHRSHWVAHRYAEHLMRDGHRTLLRLTTGNAVPVSSTYRDAVRESLRRSRRSSAD